MILDFLAPVGNHLWQSTLFAIAAAILTLALRTNQARVRYWIWLAVSIKFLIPFALLISLGGSLAKPSASFKAQSGLYSAVEVASQPFSQSTASIIPPVAPATLLRNLVHLLPAFLAVAWLCGFVATLSLWGVRWRRVSAAMRCAAPLREGREVDALRRLERVAGVRKPIPFLLSQDSLEPGIFGIVRPVMLWPAGISEHLDDAHLRAILAHEVCHVRRRDNLAAALHMIVEATFWFHPLTWWLGARLIEERERACDEEVLRLGNQAQTYAEGILKTCEFCVGSPLACVSGVTGADLKQRIVRIMSERLADKLGFGMKLLLAAAGVAAVAGPFAFGLVNVPHFSAQLLSATSGPLPSFEVASIKPTRPGDTVRFIRLTVGRFIVENQDVKNLIKFAYNFNSDDQLSGEPHWVSFEKYDIDAKVEDSLVEKLNQPSQDQRTDQIRLMVQSLLADRFKLKVSRETKELPVYALVVAKNGPKLTPTRITPPVPTGANPPGPQRFRGTRGGPGQLSGNDAPIAFLIDVLSRDPAIGGRVVLDETGLKGGYDWTLHWTPEGPPPMLGAQSGPRENMPPPDSSGPSLFTAIQEQLGLKLEPIRAPVEVLVIDHIEMPSAN